MSVRLLDLARQDRVEDRFIVSLVFLTRFVLEHGTDKAKAIASILISLWRSESAVQLQQLALLDPVSLEHVLNVIRLGAIGIPIESHIDGGAEIFEKISQKYHGSRR